MKSSLSTALKIIALSCASIFLASCRDGSNECADDKEIYVYDVDGSPSNSSIVLDVGNGTFNQSYKDRYGKNISTDLGGRIYDCSTGALDCFVFGPAISLPKGNNIGRWVLPPLTCYKVPALDRSAVNNINIECEDEQRNALYGYNVNSRAELTSFYVNEDSGKFRRYKINDECGVRIKNISNSRKNVTRMN